MNFDYRLDNAMRKSQDPISAPLFNRKTHRRSDSIDLLEYRKDSDVTKYNLMKNNLQDSPNFSGNSYVTEPNKEIDLNVITKELDMCKRRFSVPLDKSLRNSFTNRCHTSHYTSKPLEDNSKSFEDTQYYPNKNLITRANNSKSAAKIIQEYDLKEFLQSKRNDAEIYTKLSSSETNKYESLELPSSSVDLLSKYEHSFVKGHTRSISNSLKDKFRSIKRFKPN